MNFKIDVLDFAEKVNQKYLEALEIPAKRIGLSAKTAAKLVRLLSGNFDIDDDSLNELTALGFIEIKDGKISLTSKGGIVAKSLERVKQDFNAAFEKELTDAEKEAFLSINSRF